MWLGQAPKVDYIKERCHSNFRWWFEYSGGKMTDWGAHHVDIAQWAIGMDQTGPDTIEVEKKTLPVLFKDGYPMIDDRYNTPTSFIVKAVFANGVPIVIRDDTGNGITFEGDQGTIFVTRDHIDVSGAAVDAPHQEADPRIADGRASQGEAAEQPHGEISLSAHATARCRSPTCGRITGRSRLATWRTSRSDSAGEGSIGTRSRKRSSAIPRPMPGSRDRSGRATRSSSDESQESLDSEAARRAIAAHQHRRFGAGRRSRRASSSG